MDFKVDHNILELERGLSDMARKELPWAMVLALNETAKYVVEYNRRAMLRVFDRPTRWTLNAFYFWRASKSKLQASVLRKTSAGKRHYLEVQETGGIKPVGGMERALQMRAPYSGDVGRVVPAKGARRDAHGNLHRGEINRIFAQIGAMRDTSANETDRSRAKRKRKGGATYFIPKPGQLSPGIWQRSGKSLKPVLHFGTKAPSYAPRLNFYANAEKVSRAKFERLFLKHLRELTRPKG